MTRTTRWLLALLLLGTGLWLALRPTAEPELSRLPPDESAQAAPGHPALPSERLIARGDLPPAGTRSLFDHHIARLGQLPYPFSALLDSLKTLDRWNQGSVSLLIPDGRSLAKGHADYQRPRVLAAAQLEPRQAGTTIEPIYSGRLFFGFVEALNTIEIIAYNEAAGRFEFQLVHDYCAGCTPRILYAKRAICTACHQSGAPIFAVRPWSETNAHAPIARRIAEAQGIPWPEASRTHYHGVPVSTQIVMPESFDERVGQASGLRLAQQLWLDGCGINGLDCRRALLGQALSLLLRPGAFHPDAPANQRLRNLQRRQWPDAGIRVANDRLPDRLPPAPSLQDAWLRPVKRLWARLRRGGSTTDSAARLAEFEQLPRLPLALDPLSRRAPQRRLDSATLQGVHAVAGLFMPQDRDLLQALSGGQPQRVEDIIRSGRLDALLQAAPLNRTAILQGLATALGQPEPHYCCLDTRELSPPLAEDTRALAITRGSPLEAFQHYCFACHRGNPVQRLNFMGGSSEAEVLAAIRGQPRIRDVLNHAGAQDSARAVQLMPPPSSAQRAELEAALARQSDDLQRMRDAVEE